MRVDFETFSKERSIYNITIFVRKSGELKSDELLKVIEQKLLLMMLEI